jgi:hypothetical protein
VVTGDILISPFVVDQRNWSNEKIRSE